MKGPTPSMKDLAEEFTIRKKAADAALEVERQEKKASTTTSINPSGKSHRSAETLSIFRSPGEQGFAAPLKDGIEPFESVFLSSTSYLTNINPDNLE